MEHLNPHQIRAYHDRSLTPQERLVISRHIAACESCRLALLEAQPQIANTSLFIFAEEKPPSLPEQHLEYEEKIDFLEGKLSPMMRTIVDGHLEICASCRTEVEELRTFRAVLSSQTTTPILPETPRSWRERLRARFTPRLLFVGLQWCGAAVAGAMLMFVFGPSRTSPVPQLPAVNPDATTKIAQQLKAAEERAKSAQQDLKQERATTASTRQQVAALTKELAGWKAKKPPVVKPGVPDLKAGQQITNRRGDLLVAVAVDRSDAKALEGKITLPSAQIALLNKQSAQMGGAEEQVKQHRPQATFVASLRPTLVWEAVPDTKEYEIHIVDDKQNTDVVQQTLPASATDPKEIGWQVPSGSVLQTATVYRWYVRALNAEGNDVIAPAKRAFRFQTLPTAAIAEIDRKRSLYANLPLLLGGLYMRYGILDDAESVLQTLPNDPAALQLRKQIRDARRPPGP